MWQLEPELILAVCHAGEAVTRLNSHPWLLQILKCKIYLVGQYMVIVPNTLIEDFSLPRHTKLSDSCHTKTHPTSLKFSSIVLFMGEHDTDY